MQFTDAEVLALYEVLRDSKKADKELVAKISAHLDANGIHPDYQPSAKPA